MAPAYHETLPMWKSHLQKGLEEDDWALDWTAAGAIHAAAGKASASLPCRAEIVAKGPGVWAAEGLISAVIGLVGSPGTELEFAL